MQGGVTTLVDCVEQGAARVDPGKVAVVGRSSALTYGELIRGARGIAAALAGAGIGPGDRVGLWMEKTPACVQALLGVLFSGAAYVPLDPRSPWTRCRTIALDCRLAGLVVDASRLENLGRFLEGQQPRLVIVEGATREAAAQPLQGHAFVPFSDAAAMAPVNAVRPRAEDLAYVLYTSGSTGTPKGVVHTHASGLAFVQWVQQRFGIVPSDVFSSHAPFHFDLSISDLFASLGSGASVRLISASEGMVAPYLTRMMDEWGITVWYSVPSILVSMLEGGGFEAKPPTKLRVLFFAGEVFPMPQLRRLRRALPGVTLANLFGPTETNVCTYYVLPPELPDELASLPIGIGCENLETFAIGPDGREVTATGEEGVLWAKGGNIMQGYWNDPVRTARMLQPDPRRKPGVACCTGDVVRLQADGNYEFRGRRDHMVKTRGYRVELGEVEAALAAYPSVREAVAVPVPDVAIGNRIVATLVPRAGESVDVRALRAHLASVLPNYMIPASLEVREELPRTSTGKADRSALLAEWMQREQGEASAPAAAVPAAAAPASAGARNVIRTSEDGASAPRPDEAPLPWSDGGEAQEVTRPLVAAAEASAGRRVGEED